MESIPTTISTTDNDKPHLSLPSPPPHDGQNKLCPHQPTHPKHPDAKNSSKPSSKPPSSAAPSHSSSSSVPISHRPVISLTKPCATCSLPRGCSFPLLSVERPSHGWEQRQEARGRRCLSCGRGTGSMSLVYLLSRCLCALGDGAGVFGCGVGGSCGDGAGDCVCDG